MLIRPATIDDAQIIADVHVKSKRDGYKDFGSADYLEALNVQDYTKNWEEWIGSGSNVLLAFEDGVMDQATGFISFGAIQTRIKEDRGIMPSWPGEIYALYVHPDFWGAGVAQNLMKDAAPIMRKNYWDKALLWVIDKNKRAIKFYEKMGGQRAGKQKADIGGKEMTEIAFGWKDITRVAR